MPNNDKPLCPLFKELAFRSGQADNYRWKLGDDFAQRCQTPLACFCPRSCSSRDVLAKPQIVQWPRAVRHLSTSFPTAFPFHCTPRLGKKQCPFPLTSQAAAIGRIYFSAIYFESPAPRDVNIGRFFDIDYVWGSGARDAEEVGDISTIEASLKQRECKFHYTSLLWESDAAFPHISAPGNNS